MKERIVRLHDGDLPAIRLLSDRDEAVQPGVDEEDVPRCFSGQLGVIGNCEIDRLVVLLAHKGQTPTARRAASR